MGSAGYGLWGLAWGVWESKGGRSVKTADEWAWPARGIPESRYGNYKSGRSERVGGYLMVRGGQGFVLWQRGLNAPAWVEGHIGKMGSVGGDNRFARTAVETSERRVKPPKAGDHLAVKKVMKGIKGLGRPG